MKLLFLAGADAVVNVLDGHLKALVEEQYFEEQGFRKVLPRQSA